MPWCSKGNHKGLGPTRHTAADDMVVVVVDIDCLAQNGVPGQYTVFLQGSILR